MPAQKKKQNQLSLSEFENPLMINAVLETLFDLLPLDDLKRCRSVCTLWKTEGLRFLRKKSRVKLVNEAQQKNFLNSNVSRSFRGFHFSIHDWNAEVCLYLRETSPSSLETSFKLFINKEDRGRSVGMFDDLLTTYSTALTTLIVNLDWAGTVRLTVPDKFKALQFPQLKTLVINSHHMEAYWLFPLWTSIIKNSPQLDKLELRNISDETFWNELVSLERFGRLRDFTFNMNSCLHLFEVHNEILASPYHFQNLQRLCVPFNEHSVLVPVVIESLLSRVSQTLQVLEFQTNTESALSPIRFPTLPNLKVLDAGSSQFSFPTINPELFPALKEIRATYWDWVYTREELPDVHYYWRTESPHGGVRSVHIRFPDWALLNFNYQRLENFEDFCGVVRGKFPLACEFTFHNVPLRNDVNEGMERFYEEFIDNVESFKVEDYCLEEVVDPCPFEIDGLGGSQRMQVLDLGTKHWPEIWKKEPLLFSTIRGEEWIPSLLNMNSFRVLKLLWAKNLIQLLRLTDRNNFPCLEHLEFIGNICVDRYERAAVRKLRPELKIVQHKNCLCPEEDWWYLSDEEDGKVFQDLFNAKSGGFSTALRSIGLGLMSSMGMA